MPSEHDLRPDIVKLDAEGAELAIIAGMERILRDVGPLVALETGDYDGMASPATSESIEALAAVGYRCFEYDGGLRPHRRQGRYGYGNLFFLHHFSRLRPSPLSATKRRKQVDSRENLIDPTA